MNFLKNKVQNEEGINLAVEGYGLNKFKKVNCCFETKRKRSGFNFNKIDTT